MYNRRSDILTDAHALAHKSTVGMRFCRSTLVGFYEQPALSPNLEEDCDLGLFNVLRVNTDGSVNGPCSFLKGSSNQAFADLPTMLQISHPKLKIYSLVYSVARTLQ